MKTNSQSKVCGRYDHWENVLLFGKCWHCNQELTRFDPDEQRDEREPEPVSEEEVNAMYQGSQTQSEAFRLAH